MPQDIPLEASEVLAFTPASLAKFDGAPVFRLRASTARDKRFHRRLLLEHGIRYHDRDTIRAEVIKGLEQLWDADAFAEHSPVIKALWDARDDYELQLKDDPSLEWSYDSQIEDAVDELVRKVSQEWKPLRVMIADNADYGAMSGALIVAVTVQTFAGLPVKALKDRGYTTVETAEAIETALSDLEKQHGVPEGTAWAELIVACSQRMYLTEDERGNSASQSPSPTAPAPLSEMTTSETDGTSPASESSTETPSTE